MSPNTSIHPSHGRSATHCRSQGRHWHEPVRPPLRGAYRAAVGSSVRWAAHLCERCYCDSSFPSRISASCARGQLCVHRACLFLVRCLRTLISFTCCRITYWGITCCRLKCGRLAVSSRAVSSCAVASCRVLLHAIGCCTVASCAVAMHLFYRLGFLVATRAAFLGCRECDLIPHNTHATTHTSQPIPRRVLPFAGWHGLR